MEHKVSEFFSHYGHIEESIIQHLSDELKTLTAIAHRRAEEEENKQEVRRAEKNIRFVMV